MEYCFPVHYSSLFFSKYIDFCKYILVLSLFCNIFFIFILSFCIFTSLTQGKRVALMCAHIINNKFISRV